MNVERQVRRERPQSRQEEQQQVVVTFVDAYCHTLPPLTARHRQTVIEAVAAMDTLYREHEAAEINSELAGLDLLKDFHRRVVIGMIGKIPTAVSRRKRTRAGGEAAQWVVTAFGQAYTCLLNRHDPDGWLREFLAGDPAFTASIGGAPEWLERPATHEANEAE